MCGRFVSASPAAEVAEYFDARLEGAQLPPSWNVAPTDDVYAVVAHDGARRLDAFHWGLVPSWSEDPGRGGRMINARAETLATSRAYRVAYRRRRCLVPADGFYEWQSRPGSRARQPWYLSPRDEGRRLALAGLWELWSGPGKGERLRSLTIVTTRAGPDLAGLHDRMPVILDPADWDRWLDRDVARPELLDPLLVPAPPGTLVRRPVSFAVNDVRHDGPDLLAPFDPDAEPPAGSSPTGRSSAARRSRPAGDPLPGLG